MNPTLNINKLSALYSEKSGHKSDASLSIIMEIFHTIADGMKESGSVKIKGFSEFGVDAGGQVVFTPEESLEERINEPFSIFEPVEVEEDLSTAILEQNMPTEQVVAEDIVVSENIALEEVAQKAIPEVAADEKSKSDLDARLETADEEFKARLDATEKDLKARLQVAEKELEEARQKATSAEQKAAEYQLQAVDAQQQVNEANKQARDARQQAEEARLQAAEEIKRATEIAPKVKYVQVQPDSSRSVLMFLLGLCVGIILGGAAVYFIPFLMS